MATAAGLTAASTPYFMMGRRVLEQLPDNAPRAQLEQAAAQLAELASKDPAVVQLQRALAERLSMAAGVTSRPRSAVEVSVVGRPELGVGRSNENLFARP